MALTLNRRTVLAGLGSSALMHRIALAAPYAAPHQEKMVQVGGGRIYVRMNGSRDGKRPPLLMIHGAEPPAIDQHQRALGAEVAKIDRRGARCVVRQVRALRRSDLWQVVEHFFDKGPAFGLDFEVAHDRHRTDGREVRLRDPRAGDDDRLLVQRLFLAVGDRARLLHQRRIRRPLALGEHDCGFGASTERK